jgi:hypothetical protein
LLLGFYLNFLLTNLVARQEDKWRDDPSTTIASQQEGEADTCLDPSGPLPLIIMSLGRSGTDSPWQILAKLTGTKMKAVEIVGAFQDQTKSFFRALDGQTGS